MPRPPPDPPAWMESFDETVLEGRELKLRFLEEGDIKLIVRWLNSRKRTEFGMRLAPVSRKDLHNRFRVGNLNSWFIIETPSKRPCGLAMYYQTPKTDSLSIDFQIMDGRMRGHGLESEVIGILCRFIIKYSDVGFIYAEAPEQDDYTRACLREAGFEEYRRAPRDRGDKGETVMITFTRLQRQQGLARYAGLGAQSSALSRP